MKGLIKGSQMYRTLRAPRSTDYSLCCSWFIPQHLY